MTQMKLFNDGLPITIENNNAITLRWRSTTSRYYLLSLRLQHGVIIVEDGHKIRIARNPVMTLQDGLREFLTYAKGTYPKSEREITPEIDAIRISFWHGLNHYTCRRSVGSHKGRQCLRASNLEAALDELLICVLDAIQDNAPAQEERIFL